MKLVVNNSFCKFEGDLPSNVEDLIRQVLTYKNDIESEKGQLFFQLKLAKRYNNRPKYFATLAAIKALEASEYVCLYKDRKFPTGLLNIVQEALNMLGASYTVEDDREKPGETAIIRWANKPYEPRDYQKKFIDSAVAAGRGVIVSAVGTGKSLMMGYIIKAISVKTLVIVPSVGLSGQLYNDFCEWFGAGNVELLDAKKIRKLGTPKAVSIVTVQSLGSLKKSGEFKDFIQKIDAVHCDEVHHAGAATYTKLLEDMDHIYYRFGYTGTFLRNDSKTLEMWSFLSNVLGEYPAHLAIKNGFLTPMEVHVYQMSGKGNKKYPKEYESNYCGNSILLQKVYDICSEVDPTKQILILVKQKDKAGKLIHEYLNTLGIDNSYISGDNSRDEINSTIKSFNEKRIRVLIGSSVIGEGIDVRSTDHLIMCQGGKSEVTMVQAIGRAIRLYEGKKVSYIHDFRFVNTHYMQKHCDERIEVYQRNFHCQVYEHSG